MRKNIFTFAKCEIIIELRFTISKYVTGGERVGKRDKRNTPPTAATISGEI